MCWPVKFCHLQKIKHALQCCCFVRTNFVRTNNHRLSVTHTPFADQPLPVGIHVLLLWWNILTELLLCYMPIFSNGRNWRQCSCSSYLAPEINLSRSSFYLDAIQVLLAWVMGVMISVRTTSEGTRWRATNRSHFPLCCSRWIEGVVGGRQTNWELNFFLFWLRQSKVFYSCLRRSHQNPTG